MAAISGYNFLPATQPSGFDASRYTSDLLKQGAGAGFFDPMGSDVIRRALERRAARTMANQQQSGSVLARLVGLSPEQQRVAFLDTARGASTGAANFLNDAQLQQLLSSEGFLRSLLTGQLSFEHQRALAELMDRLGGGTLGGYLGQLLGVGAGGFVGEAGQKLAGKLIH